VAQLQQLPYVGCNLPGPSGVWLVSGEEQSGVQERCGRETKNFDVHKNKLCGRTLSLALTGYPTLGKLVEARRTSLDEQLVQSIRSPLFRSDGKDKISRDENIGMSLKGKRIVILAGTSGFR
jgi:hypothetical protein